MKFILFNVVVAAGLVFLLTGTDDPVPSAGRGVLSEAVLKVTKMGDQVAERLARAGPSKSREGRPAGAQYRSRVPSPSARAQAGRNDEAAALSPGHRGGSAYDSRGAR